MAPDDDGLDDLRRRFRALFDRAAIFAVLLAPDGTVVEANALTLDAGGHDREALVGLRLWETGWYRGDRREQLRSSVLAAAAGGSERLAMPVTLAGGDRRAADMTVSPVPGPDGSVAAVLVLGMDVTDALTASESDARRLQALLEQPRLFVLVLDARGRVREMNDALRRRTGHHDGRRPEPVWSSDLIGTDPEALAQARETMRLAASGQVAIHRQQVPLPDGTSVLAEFVVTPIVDGAGVVDGFLAIGYESASRVEAEARIAHERAEAEAARRAAELKTTFLANMSHEIRTPMNAVIGMASLLAETDLTLEQREAVEVIRSSGEHLLTLVNEVLDLSKADAGNGVVLETQPLDLRATVEAAVAIVAPQAREKGLALTLDVAPGLPGTVLGDVGRLRQVVLNLVGNAVKFTEAGSVAVVLQAARGATADEVRVELEVRDTGPGIPAERLGEVFEPFQQLDVSATREHGGTGLGLSIALALAMAMGGDVEAHSVPGEGSTFRMWFPTRIAQPVALPAAPASRAPQAADEEARMGERRPLRILLVEDAPVNRLVVTRLLDRLGYHADEAEHGAEAVAAVATRAYDLVLMDVQMPVMDGLTATRTIVERCGADRPRIVGVTAAAFEDDRRECLEAGMDDFVPKPLRLHDLLAVLEATSPRAR